MKKLLFLLLLANVGFAQNGFIEIEVKDTITMKPTGFKYLVSMSEANAYNYAVETDEQSDAKDDGKEKALKKEKEIQSFLSKNKYTFKKQDDNFEIKPALNIYGIFGSQEGFVVTVKTIDELRKLKNDLETLEDISGFVLNIEFGDQSEAEAILLQRLINKAKTKAESIAAMTNLKLGKIIEVKEVKEIDNAGNSFMELIMEMQRSKRGNPFGNNLAGKISKSIIVKFQAQ